MKPVQLMVEQELEIQTQWVTVTSAYLLRRYLCIRDYSSQVWHCSVLRA